MKEIPILDREGNSYPFDVLSISMPTVLAHIRAGKLKMLAVSSPRRVAALPNTPTVSEAGFADFEEHSWVGLFAPAGTDAAIVDKLNAEVNRALADSEAKARFERMGAEPEPMLRAQFAGYVSKESARWAKIIKTSGVTAD